MATGIKSVHFFIALLCIASVLNLGTTLLVALLNYFPVLPV